MTVNHNDDDFFPAGSIPFLTISLALLWGLLAYDIYETGGPPDFFAMYVVGVMTATFVIVAHRWDEMVPVWRIMFAPQWISWQKIMPAYALGAFIVPLAVFVFFPPEIYPKTFIGALIIMAGAVARITYVDVRDLRYEIEPEDPWRSIYALWSVFVIASGIALAWNLQGDARQLLSQY